VHIPSRHVLTNQLIIPLVLATSRAGKPGIFAPQPQRLSFDRLVFTISTSAYSIPLCSHPSLGLTLVFSGL
jgi:hypothetical protein